MKKASHENPAQRTSLAGVLMLVNVLVKMVINLASISLCLKYLSREEYGLWIILQTLTMYLSLCEMGLGQTVVNFTGEAFALNDKKRINQILSSAFILFWLIVLPVWLLAVAISILCPIDIWLLKESSPQISDLFRTAFRIAATFALLQIPFITFTSTLLGLRESPLRQVYDLVFALVVFAAAAAALITGKGILGLILAINVTSFLLSLSVYPLLVKPRAPFLRLRLFAWQPELIRKLFANSGFFFVMGIAFLLDRSAGNLLIGKYGDLTQVPSMFVLLVFFRVLGWSVIDVFSRALLPYIILLGAQHKEQRVVFYAGLATKIGFAFASILAALSWLLAERGLRWWLGADLFPGYLPLAFLAGSFLADSLFLATTNVLAALNRHRVLAVAAIWRAMLTVGLGAVGAHCLPHQPFVGITAGIFAASLLGQFLVLPWIAQRELNLNRRLYWEYFIARPLLLPAFLIFMILAWQKFGVDLYLHWIRLLTATAAIICISLLTFWHIMLEEQERLWLRDLGNRYRRNKSSALVS